MSLYKRWSNKDVRQYTLFFLFGAIIVAMMLIMLQAGLRCVDVNGCLREHCSEGYIKYLRKDYKYIL
jgi:hypothetical protein